MEKYHGFIVVENWSIEMDENGVWFGRRKVIEMVGYVGFYKSKINMFKRWGLDFSVVWV